jgi:murein DD-endopeptidase MepM/ murein hydrolase activator NlpD
LTAGRIKLVIKSKFAMDLIKTKWMNFLAIAALLTLALVAAYRFLPRERGLAVEQPTPTPGKQSPQVPTSDPGYTYTEISLPDLSVQQPVDVGIFRTANLHTVIPPRPRDDVITYTVQVGDNLFTIADKYGLKPETILWGNYEVLRDNPQLLTPAQVLNILPVDGVYYQYAEGDTLQKVAEFFKVDAEAILGYPGNKFDLTQVVDGNVDIPVGTWLIVPGGSRPLKDWGPPPITRANPAAAAYYGSGYCGQIYEGAIGTGSFVWPTVEKYLSGNDYNPAIHPGIDIAGSLGNAVYATDSGVVVFAGWSEFGYGNLIVIDHGNGWQSAYAHLSALNVGCGQSVGQGTVIGALGSTGNSTGPHLHFELRSEIYGKVNPWDFVSP